MGDGLTLELFGQRSAEEEDQTKSVYDLAEGGPVLNDRLSSGFERTYSYLSGGMRLNRVTPDTRFVLGLQIRSSNLDGTVQMCRASLGPLKKAGGGSIINISSVTGSRPFGQITAYCVSKAAVDMYTRCAALELAPHNIRVNAIAPGVVVTNLHTVTGAVEDYDGFLKRSRETHPLGFVGEGKDIAALAVYLASDESRWATGGIYPLDGGRANMSAR